MFWRNRNDISAAYFADQFEPDRGGFLYRNGKRAAPIRVTAAERDELVESFGRRVRLLQWALVAAVIIMVFAFVGYEDALHVRLPRWSTQAGCGVLVVAFLIIWRRIWNAPARRLEGRVPVGPARTRSDVRREMIADMSWGYMVATPLLMLVLIVEGMRSRGGNPDAGDWAFTILGGVGLLVWLWAMVLKLRLRP